MSLSSFVTTPIILSVHVDGLIFFNHEEHFDIILRSTQLAPFLSNNDCNSGKISYSSSSVSHVEGGWPKEIDSKQQDQVITGASSEREYSPVPGVQVHEEDRED